MKKPEEVLKIFEKYTPLVDAEMKRVLAERPNYLMYQMMSYFLGFLDEGLNESKQYGGKRFRPGITLLLGDFYGVQEKLIKPATSIELFHNFTLIHDDIEDNDTVRRGRPTVWKKWGLAHGINVGDAQFALAMHELHTGSNGYAESPEPVEDFMSGIYLNVTEGQFLDFTLAEKSLSDDFVTEDNYLEMIKNKTAVLVAASAKMAGLVSGQTQAECQNLWDYGLHLGMAFQLNDDIISIWGKSEETGKEENKDIIERKKTLPIISLFKTLKPEYADRLKCLYDAKKPLNMAEVSEIKSLAGNPKVREYVCIKVREHLKQSETAIKALSLKPEQKELLININRNIVPEMEWWNA